MLNLKQIHDKLFRYALNSRKSLQKVFLLMPPHLSKDFDLRTIKKESVSHIDENLQEHLADVVASCQWKNNKNARVSFIYEHKSYPDVMLRLQINRYIINGYEQQFREKGNKTPPFDLIIGVLLKHGDKEWEVPDFSDYVYTLSNDYIQYIPSFKIIILDLSKISDETLQMLGYSFLYSALFLFKHKGDKEFIKQHYKKIFIFVEEEANKEQLEKYIRVLVLYIYAAFKLEKEEVKDMVKQVPPLIQSTMQSTYDILIEEGRQLGLGEGLAQGMEAGLEKGLEKGIEVGLEKGSMMTTVKVTIEVTIEMMKNLPFLDNEQIGKMSKLDLDHIKLIRTTFFQNEKIETGNLIKELFKNIPILTKKDSEDLEKWLLNLWLKFTKEPTNNEN